MGAREVFQQIFAIAGLILWSIQLSPQVYKNWKRRSTEGQSPGMIALWYFASIPLGSYLIFEGDPIPLVVQAFLFCALSLACYTQWLLYTKRWTLSLSIFFYFLFVGVTAGIGFGLVKLLEFSDNNNVQWLLIITAYSSPVLMGLGFLPQLLDIFR
eukprot:Colp12_sorted_trinity150504_noHs@30466